MWWPARCTAGAQLFPGALFQAQSQRAAETYHYFASGSLNKSLTILGLDPLLLGGAHGYPISYFGTYNLPEISSYIGIFAVMGLFGLLARRHRQRAKADGWWIWYVIFGVGLLFTWGGFTPFGHVMYEIPLYNRQRLLNRNILVVDLALAVILATWIDAMFLTPRTPTASAASEAPVELPIGQQRRRWTSDVVLALLAPAAVVVLQIVLLAGGAWFPDFLHVPGQVTRARLGPLVAFLTIPTAIALVAMAIVIGRRRLGRRLPIALVALMVVDLAVFNSVIQVAPGLHAAQHRPRARGPTNWRPPWQPKEATAPMPCTGSRCTTRIVSIRLSPTVSVSPISTSFDPSRRCRATARSLMAATTPPLEPIPNSA